MHFVAPGKVLIAWDSGLGPSWDYDPGTLAETTGKLVGITSVYRSLRSDQLGVCIGRTRSEAFIDRDPPPLAVVYYRAYAEGGGQVGPTFTVHTKKRPTRADDATRDHTPPSAAQGFNVLRGAGGNRLQFRPSVDAESHLLCYLVYDSGQQQPDSVVWVDSVDVDSSATYDRFLDRSANANKPYVVTALDHELHESERTDVATPEGWVETRPHGDASLEWMLSGVSDDGNVLLSGEASAVFPAYGRVYVSTDNAATWSEVRPAGDVAKYWRAGCVSGNGQVMLVGVEGGRLYRSVDGGQSWFETQPAGAVNRNWQACAAGTDGSALLACSYYGRLWRSLDSGASWTEMTPSGAADRNWQACDMSDDGQVLLAGIGGSPGGYGYLHLSSNGGTTWASTGPAVGSVYWGCCAVSGDGAVMLAGIDFGRLYRSINGGGTWAEVRPAGDADFFWRDCCLSADGSYMLVLAYGGRVWSSSDSGATWEEERPYDDLAMNWQTCACDASGSTALAGIDNGRLYVRGGA